MMRKLMAVLIGGMVVLSGLSSIALAESGGSSTWSSVSWSSVSEYEKATGNKIEKFNESPLLKEMVRKGLIPEVRTTGF